MTLLCQKHKRLKIIENHLSSTTFNKALYMGSNLISFLASFGRLFLRGILANINQSLTVVINLRDISFNSHSYTLSLSKHNV
jgi:hypothetical protein